MQKDIHYKFIVIDAVIIILGYNVLCMLKSVHVQCTCRYISHLCVVESTSNLRIWAQGYGSETIMPSAIMQLRWHVHPVFLRSTNLINFTVFLICLANSQFWESSTHHCLYNWGFSKIPVCIDVHPIMDFLIWWSELLNISLDWLFSFLFWQKGVWWCGDTRVNWWSSSNLSPENVHKLQFEASDV